MQQYLNSKKITLIYFIEPDQQLRREISRQINYYGYEVRTFGTILEVEKSFIEDDNPYAIIVHLSFQAGDLSERFSELLNTRNKKIHLMVIAERGDMDSRLQAVRMGCRAYFTTPVDVGLIVGELDRFLDPENIFPYKIICVDPSPSIFPEAISILEKSHLQLNLINNPQTLLAEIANFRPDLILIALGSNDWDGTELARLIRQEEVHSLIPIVFISAKSEIMSKIEILRGGGEDIFYLPVHPESFLPSVRAFCEKTRYLRLLLERDSLTGLLNHTTLMAKLNLEISTAGKQSCSLSFAMIDIDHFKAINIKYGHAAGDAVIKNLGRFLKQRLSSNGEAGRYGGEEFGVILKEMDAQDAGKTMDKIRMEFAKIRHQSFKGDFYSTFSCGVACFPDFTNSSKICRAADRILLKAKQKGRNQVRIAHKTKKQIPIVILLSILILTGTLSFRCVVLRQITDPVTGVLKRGSCISIDIPPITLTPERTAAERQLIGENRELEKQGWLIASSQSSRHYKRGVSTNLMEKIRRLYRERAVLEFFSKSAREYKIRSFLGENKKGYLVPLPGRIIRRENKNINQSDLKKSHEIAREINRARTWIYLYYRDLELKKKKPNIKTIIKQYKVIYRDNAGGGIWVEERKNRWVRRR